MKIISGGQRGADLGALIAAKKMGFETGGEMPKGFLNEDGPCPWMEANFGMTQGMSSEYKPRTRKNVANVDATLRIALNFNSPGEKCTRSAIVEYGKPWFDVKLNEQWGTGSLLYTVRAIRSKPPTGLGLTVQDAIVAWLVKEGVDTLNVAGNAEKTAPGIESWVTDFMLIVLRKWREAQ